MSRSEVLQADLERIEAMSPEDFDARWGAWADATDRDVVKVRERWIRDLRRGLAYAQLEDEGVRELIAAKDAYRADPSEANRARKAAAVDYVQSLRTEERDQPGRMRISGDAFTSDTPGPTESTESTEPAGGNQ